MSPKLERFLTRLLLVVIAAAAITTAGRYDGEAQAALYFLAAVAIGGLLAPIPTARRESETRRKDPAAR